MPGSHPYAHNHSTGFERSTIHGIPQRKKQFDDLRPTRKPEVQVWKSALLVQGVYVDTVGRNKKAIAEYIKNQSAEDIAADQISLKEYIDPFTGSKKSKA